MFWLMSQKKPKQPEKPEKPMVRLDDTSTSLSDATQ